VARNGSGGCAGGHCGFVMNRQIGGAACPYSHISPGGANELSSALQRWEEWEERPKSRRDDPVLTPARKPTSYSDDSPSVAPSQLSSLLSAVSCLPCSTSSAAS